MHELFDIDDESVTRFLASWHGPPDRTGGIVDVSRQLPKALLGWYAAAGRYSAPVTFHNRVLDPAEVAMSDGKMVFWLENQEVYEWAFDEGADDPLVCERSTSHGEPWHPTGVRLSAFMVSVAVFEAIMGAEHGIYVSDLGAAQLEAVLAPLRALPMPGPFAGAQLYAGDGLLAFASVDDHASETTRWVQLAATTPGRLAHVQGVSR